MKEILIIGAGRSATTLIDYLLERCGQFDWRVTICDMNLDLANSKTGGSDFAKAEALNINDAAKRSALISKSDVVVSMLPPFMHTKLVEDCIRYKTPMVNASYVSEEMQSYQDEVSKAGILFLCEMGLDPGIDHMSAMELMDQIRGEGGKIKGFKSYTGGLVAPESDDNPWHYKFSWSPRNVVVAGQGTAQFVEDGHYRFIPYHRIFTRARPIFVPGMGEWESYANRDSLSYRDKYGLHDVETLYRGTIRHRGFCKAWNVLVQLGMTDSHFSIPDDKHFTYRDLLESFCNSGPEPLRKRIAHMTDSPIDDHIIDQIEWLGLLDEVPIDPAFKSPADVLEDILLKKWKLRAEDKDMIIMQHEIDYTRDNKAYQLKSTLLEIGEDNVNTAMSRLVGLPMAVYVKHLLTEGTSLQGIQVPVVRDIYQPVLKELATLGVTFSDVTEEK